MNIWRSIKGQLVFYHLCRFLDASRTLTALAPTLYRVSRTAKQQVPVSCSALLSKARQGRSAECLTVKREIFDEADLNLENVSKLRGSTTNFFTQPGERPSTPCLSSNYNSKPQADSSPGV